MRQYTLFVLLCLVAPFIVLFWLSPFSTITIGNDYSNVNSDRKEFAYALRSGTFPMYIPLHLGGVPVGAKTLGALFHPSLPLVAMIPGYWTVNGEIVLTSFRLLTLGFCHFLLFEMFSALGFRPWDGIFLGTLAVYNQRMLDSLRYGGSLENYTGLLMLLVSFVFLFLAVVRKQKQWPSFLGSIAAGYWFFTGGHPQWMYLGTITIFVLLLLLPDWIALFVPIGGDHWRVKRQFWSLALGAILVAACLSAPYFLSFYYDFFLENSARAHQSYERTTLYQPSIPGFLMNLTAPWLADVHSGFGGSPLFALAALLPAAVLFGQRIPRVLWAIYGFSLLVFLYCLGDATPLHPWVYRHIPLFTSFRAPGRLAIALPLSLMLMLAWLLRQERTLLRRFVYLAIIATSLVFVAEARSIKDTFTPKNINSLRGVWVLGQFAAGMFVLCVFYLTTIKKQLVAVFVAISLAYSASVLRFGSWIDRDRSDVTFETIQSAKRDGRNYSYIDFLVATTAFTRYWEQAKKFPPIAYVGHEMRTTPSEEEATQLFGQDHSRAPKIYIENGNRVEVQGLKSLTPGEKDSLALEELSWNRLRFRVNVQEPGLMVLGMPGHHWEAYQDRTSYPVFYVNGGFPAVRLDTGEHRIEFRYYSRAMVTGGIISLVTLWLLFVFMWKRYHWRYLKPFAAALLILLMLVGVVWRKSLYSGKPWGTRYVWTSDGDTVDSK